LHSIASDASGPCFILLLTTFLAQSARARMGLISQFGAGAGAKEGQDPQVVSVKGSEVAGDLVVECHGWSMEIQ
jgi:hypothetical protein